MSNTAQIVQTITIDPYTGAIHLPIYQAPAFVQEATGVRKCFDHIPNGNPTKTKLEKFIAKLQEGVISAAPSQVLAEKEPHAAVLFFKSRPVVLIN